MSDSDDEYECVRLYEWMHGDHADDVRERRAAQLTELAREGWVLVCVADGLAYLRRAVPRGCPLDLDAEEAVHRKCLAGTACYHSARDEHTQALVVLAELRADHAATARVVAAARAHSAARAKYRAALRAADEADRAASASGDRAAREASLRAWTPVRVTSDEYTIAADALDAALAALDGAGGGT